MSKLSPQGKEFIKAAREHGADVPEAEFDRALRKVASAPPAPIHKPVKGKPKSPAPRKSR